MFIKIGGKNFLLEEMTLIEEDYQSTDYPGYSTVRFQYRNRQDEVANVAGRPVHLKHGVYELPPDLSEQFRWFLRIFGPSLGIVDVQERFKDRVNIEAAFEQLKAQQGAGKQEKPVYRKDGKVLTMPPFPPMESEGLPPDGA